MNEKIKKFITDLKQLSIQLPELREYFWLDIDRSSDTDKQRGILFDSKFEKIKEQFLRTEKTMCKFLEDSFHNPKEEAKKEALKKLISEFQNFDEWDEIAKNALIEKYTNDILQKMIKSREDDNERASRSKPSNLLVIFSDAKQICEKNAAKTLAETIRTIGIEKVIGLNLIHSKVPFISKDKDAMRLAVPLENGYFVNAHSGAQTKKRQLEEISRRLNLNLKIDIVER